MPVRCDCCLQGPVSLCLQGSHFTGRVEVFHVDNLHSQIKMAMSYWQMFTYFHFRFSFDKATLSRRLFLVILVGTCTHGCCSSLALAYFTWLLPSLPPGTIIYALRTCTCTVVHWHISTPSFAVAIRLEHFLTPMTGKSFVTNCLMHTGCRISSREYLSSLKGVFTSYSLSLALIS